MGPTKTNPMTARQAITNGILALRDMHGYVVNAPDGHDTDPDKCDCWYGRSIRKLKEVRRGL